MTIDTYNGLIASIKNNSDRSKNPEWLDELPNFITLTEAKIRKRLRIGQQERTAYITTSDNKTAYTPPPRYQSDRTIEYRPPPDDAGNEGKYCNLTYVSPMVLSDMLANQSAFGPVKFTYVDGQLHMAGAPSQGGTLRIVYIEGIEPLTSDAPTNWLLTDYPDLYLNGALNESALFQKDFSSPYGVLFDNELKQLIAQDKSDRWSGPPRAATVPGL